MIRMIEHVDTIVSVCGSFSCVCVAAGWLIKTIRAVKKPGDDIHEKLASDKKRLNKLEEELESISKTQPYDPAVTVCDAAAYAHQQQHRRDRKAGGRDQQLFV